MRPAAGRRGASARRSTWSTPTRQRRELVDAALARYAGRTPAAACRRALVERPLRVSRCRSSSSGTPRESIAYLNHPVRYDTRRAVDLLAPHGPAAAALRGLRGDDGRLLPRARGRPGLRAGALARRGGVAARLAPGRGTTAARSEFPAHGRADRRPQRRGRDGRDPEPPEWHDVADAAPDLEDYVDADTPIFAGGPVQPTAGVVLAEVTEVGDPSSVTSCWYRTWDELADVIDGSGRLRVFAGLRRLGRGQLEDEIERDDWILDPAQPDDVFRRTRNPLGERAGAKRGPIRSCGPHAGRSVPELSFAYRTAGNNVFRCDRARGFFDL